MAYPIHHMTNQATTTTTEEENAKHKAAIEKAFIETFGCTPIEVVRTINKTLDEQFK